MCVCLSVREDVSGTTRAIFTNFSVHVPYGRGSVLLRQDDEIPRGRGILGIFWPFKNIRNLRRSRRCRIRCKGIIQSPITPCSRRDHSVCQTSASGKILSAGNVAYRPGRGDGSTQGGRSLISTIALLVLLLWRLVVKIFDVLLRNMLQIPC